MKTLLSIFDHSGEWSRPYAEAGYNVIQIDVQHDPALHDIRRFNVEYLIDTLYLDTVDGILGAPPCTHFANSGAQYWRAKDADGRTADAVEMVHQFLRCVEYFKPDFWAMENPIGRLPKLVPHIGKPFRFDPCDFAGYREPYLSDEHLAQLKELEARFAQGGKFTREEIELIKNSNRYTKATCIWGRFIHPTKQPRPPIRVCSQGSWLQTLGNAGAATKRARSVTPGGFAEAFFQSNNHGEKQTQTWNAERAAEWIANLHDGPPGEATDLEVTALFDPDEHPETNASAALEAFRRLYPAGTGNLGYAVMH